MKEWLAWVDENDLKNHQDWFFRYLMRYGLIITPGYYPPSIRLKIQRVLSSHEPAYAESIIRKMKAAWAQKMRRMNSPRQKSYNFVMSKSVQGKLQYLARKNNLTINQLVEKLVFEQEELTRDMQKRHREEVANLRKKIRERSHEPGNLQQSNPDHAHLEGIDATLQGDNLKALVLTIVDQRINARLDQNSQPTPNKHPPSYPYYSHNPKRF